jgi:DNA-binding XRE family transcriptional regulator
MIMPYHSSLLIARPAKEPRFRSALEEARVWAGFSQTQLAERAGVRRETIARIETRRMAGQLKGCRQETARRIAQALGVENIDELFEPFTAQT